MRPEKRVSLRSQPSVVLSLAKGYRPDERVENAFIKHMISTWGKDACLECNPQEVGVGTADRDESGPEGAKPVASATSRPESTEHVLRTNVTPFALVNLDAMV